MARRAVRSMPMAKGSKYAWVSVRELEPGVAYEATHGQHYTCQSVSFAGALYKIAKEQGWKATVTIFETKVIFSFYRPDSYMRPNMAAYPVVMKERKRRR